MSSTDELDLLIGKMKTAAAPLREVLRELHARYAPVDEGKVADYIPELAKADRRWFGIAIATTDGSRQWQGGRQNAAAIADWR